jgi:hypothetical protein
MGDWMTLQECADDIKVTVEVVRGWCVDHEAGKGGLPSTHFGRTAADKAERLNRRVHVDDWREFKLARRRQECREDRQANRAADRVRLVEPLDYVGLRRMKAASDSR